MNKSDIIADVPDVLKRYATNTAKPIETIKDINTLLFEKDNEILALQNALTESEEEKDKLIIVIAQIASRNIYYQENIKRFKNIAKGLI